MPKLRLPRLSPRSLQTRVIASWILLIVVIEAVGLLVISTVETASARKSASVAVATGARIFERFLDIDSQRVIEGVRSLIADPAFRESVAAGDRNALSAAVAKHGKHIGATTMLVIDAERRVVVNSQNADVGRPFAYSKLLDRAVAAQQASAVLPVNGQLHQVVVVPLRSQDAVVGWIAAGIRIDDAFVTELRNLTRLDVSILSQPGEGDWQNRASTLDAVQRSNLAKDFNANRYSSTDSEGNAEYADDAITRVINLAPRADQGAVAVLQGRLAPALEPVYALLLRLALIAVAGVAAAVAAGFAMGRGIVAPIREMTAAARRALDGDYTPIAAVPRSDEIGKLASAFRAMQESAATNMSKLTELAHRDPLTGLPSRVLLVDRLSQAMASSTRAGAPVAVMIVSLDGFAAVNETLGRPIGDLLLREVAARLRSVIRRSSDTVARIGGDEFAVVMCGSRASEVLKTATAILRALEAKTTLDGHVVDVRAGIGIATSPEHGNDPAKLLERADVAKHAAKHAELRVVVWDDRYDEHGEMRLAMMSDLKKAVDNEELALIYQPSVSLRDSSEYFVEALVRWQHPSRGLVPPAEFVPLAEQTGFIRTITQWVLGEAIAQCAAWRSRGLAINVAINLSACDVIDGELPGRLEELLEKESCRAEWISFEIAESAIVGEPGHALKCLERLRALGCKLVIDDYGSGHASLAYLRRLPLHELKIDRSFITGMAAGAGDAHIVRSTIDLAHDLDLTVVAGGVEDEATLEQLRALGCDGAQGFLFSRPMVADDVPGWLRESPWIRQDDKPLRRVS